RRTLARVTDMRSTPVREVMTRSPRTVNAGQLAVEAVKIMEDFKVNQILVVDDAKHLVGALNTHDLMRAKVI
ncbi:MAG: CBS domain-containing protein, partial [Burkholderiales bacterium]